MRNQAAGGNRNEAARPGPYGVHEIKRGQAVPGEYRAHCADARVMQADVVDVRSRELPLGGLRLLGEGEDIYVVGTRQATQQCQQCRDHPVFSRAIDASRYHQSDSHITGALPRLAVADGRTYDMRGA